MDEMEYEGLEDLGPHGRNDGRDRRNYRYRYHSTCGTYPFTRIKRSLKKFIGKNINDAFSYFCKGVPDYQQAFFLKVVEDMRNGRVWDELVDYSLDGDIIVSTRDPERAKPVTFTSHDYATAKAVAGSDRLIDIDKLWLYEYGCRMDRKLVNVVVSGFAEEFGSRRDPRYKKLSAEKRDAERKEKREKVKSKTTVLYSFLTKEERERKKDGIEDRQKMAKHGFDDDSFRGDGYHGQQRKKRHGS